MKPGVYRLDCIARADGPGPCIYAVGDSKMLKPIPVYGNKGGELVKMLRQGLADRQANDSSETKVVSKSKTTLNIMGMEFVINETTQEHTSEQYNEDEGYGWSIVSIDNIVVSGDSIAYGVSTDEAFTDRPCRAIWLSATDFKLTRTGDLPKAGKKERRSK